MFQRTHMVLKLGSLDSLIDLIEKILPENFYIFHIF